MREPASFPAGQLRRGLPLLFAKGMAMGAVDLVPGVSGGTIAFITGIYEELIDSLRNLGPGLIGIGFREGFGAFWRAANGNFLATLFAGVALSIFSFARLIIWTLEHHPILVWSFFFGLILASVLLMARRHTRFAWPERLGMIAGILVALLIVFSPPLQIHHNLVTVFFAGALAICAMILPGISGSFVLVLIGMYRTLLDAVVAMDIALLSVFCMGAVIGLVLASHFLSWLLHHYHNLALATLTGFLVGSLALIWPWKLPLEIVYDDRGREVVLSFENLLPWHYQQLTGLDASAVAGGACMILGLVAVLGLEYVGSRNRARSG